MDCSERSGRGVPEGVTAYAPPMPPRSVRRPLALVALLALVLTACNWTDDQDAGGDDLRVDEQTDATDETDETDAPDGGDDPGELAWEECEFGECATLEVPLDYEDPDGETIDVALARVPAEDPDARIGSLLMNFGGPGAGGREYFPGVTFAFPTEIAERFDLVTWDPRGTGDTIPVRCVDSIDPLMAFDYSPDTPEELAAVEAGVVEFQEACEEENGDRLEHISSQDSVRDMDEIRAALGDEQLTYLGYSYGTYYGALYAEFFPENVRALLLDGAVDPELTPLEGSLQQAVGFEDSLNAFLADCAADIGCTFHGGEDTRAAFDALAAAVDANPVPADDDRTMGPNELQIGIASALYSGEFEYDRLAQALADVDAGDASEMLTLTDEYTGRGDDGEDEGILQSFYAIGCIDGPSLGTPEELPALEEQFATAAPYFGPDFLYSSLICATWPVPPLEDPGPLTGEGAAPILVVGTTGDPATPVQHAEALAEQLDSGVLLIVEGSTHTSTFLGGNPCADDIGIAYLVDLELPAEGERCGEEAIDF